MKWGCWWRAVRGRLLRLRSFDQVRVRLDVGSQLLAGVVLPRVLADNVGEYTNKTLWVTWICPPVIS